MEPSSKLYQSKLFIALSLGSVGALSGTFFFLLTVGQRSSTSLSFVAFILPLLLGMWLILLLGYWLIQLSKHSFQHSKPHLLLLATFLLGAFLILPPTWLFRARLVVERVQPQVKHESVISLMTWNLQRLGDLEPIKTRTQVRQKKLSCIASIIEQSERKNNLPVNLFTFQEITNQNLKYIEKKLAVNCQHITYHNRKKGAGLGICVKEKGSWQINYARNIILNGEGRWRTLFAELSHRDHQATTFNLINVHFLPHRVNEGKVKKAFWSPQNLKEMIHKINDTSESQIQQAEGLLSVIKDYRDPTILAGDFNAPSYAGAHPLLLKFWDDVWARSGINFGATKYFAELIPFRVDYIYALKDAFILLQAEVLNADCSDHKPLITHLGLPKKS